MLSENFNLGFEILRSPHKLKKFNVGESRYHITTGTRELSPGGNGDGDGVGERGVSERSVVKTLAPPSTEIS